MTGNCLHFLKVTYENIVKIFFFKMALETFALVG